MQPSFTGTTPEQETAFNAGAGIADTAFDPCLGLTEGRIVHYVLDQGPSKGVHRPAIVVRIWTKGQSTIQLQVFTDGTNDGDAYRNGIYWATSVQYAHARDNQPHTWHWPEHV